MHLRISRLLAILVLLVALSLVVWLIATGLLLIGHEKPAFLSWFWLFIPPCVKRAARKQAESAPHGSFDLNASFPLLLGFRAVTMNKPI